MFSDRRSCNFVDDLIDGYDHGSDKTLFRQLSVNLLLFQRKLFRCRFQRPQCACILGVRVLSGFLRLDLQVVHHEDKQLCHLTTRRPVFAVDGAPGLSGTVEIQHLDGFVFERAEELFSRPLTERPDFILDGLPEG